MYDGGILRFAVSKELMQRLEEWKATNGYPSVSDAARQALERGLDSQK